MMLEQIMFGQTKLVRFQPPINQKIAFDVTLLKKVIVFEEHQLPFENISRFRRNSKRMKWFR